MQHSTGKPTAQEDAWLKKLSGAECICCLEAGYRAPWRVLPEIHHIVEGGRRLGHFYTLPLCRGHHRGVFTARQRAVLPAARLVAISDGLKQFAKAFATERVLWELLAEQFGLDVSWPTSKILPRRSACSPGSR